MSLVRIDVQVSTEDLLQLTDLAEQMDARRVEYLAELAQLRQITFAALVRDLDIHPTTRS